MTVDPGTVLAVGGIRGVPEMLRDCGLRYRVVVGRDAWRRLQGAADIESYVPVHDVRDVQHVLAALARAGWPPDAFRAVVPYGEDAIVTAAVIAALGGQDFPQVPDALAWRDKKVQKALLRDAGVVVADFAEVSPVSPPRVAAAAIGFPAILKPVMGAGAELTARVSSLADLERTYRDAASRALDPTFLLERELEGRELYCDGVVRGGEVRVLSVATYGCNLLQLQSGEVMSGVTFDPGEHADLYRSARVLVQRALTVLGLHDGVFHLECFETDQGLTFSECAARTGGALVVEAFERKFGVNLLRATLDAAVGRPWRDPAAPVTDAVGWTFLPASPGRIVRMPAAGEIRSLPGVTAVRLERAVGDVMPDMRRDSLTRAGLALVVAGSATELDERIGALVSWFRDHTDVEARGAPVT